MPLKDRIVTAKKEKQVLSEQYKLIKEEVEAKQKEIDEALEQKNSFKLKMKKLNKKNDIIKEIEALKYHQKNEKMTLNEEKAICKQISELEKSV